MMPFDLAEGRIWTHGEERLDFRARLLDPIEFHQSVCPRQQGIGIGRSVQLERAPRFIKAVKRIEGAPS